MTLLWLVLSWTGFASWWIVAAANPWGWVWPYAPAGLCLVAAVMLSVLWFSWDTTRTTGE